MALASRAREDPVTLLYVFDYKLTNNSISLGSSRGAVVQASGPCAATRAAFAAQKGNGHTGPCPFSAAEREPIIGPAFPSEFYQGHLQQADILTGQRDVHEMPILGVCPEPLAVLG